MTNESLSYILASSGSATSAASAGSQTSQSDADKIEIEKGYLISQQEQERGYRRGGEKKGKEERENQNQPTRIRWFWNSGVDTATNVTVWIQFSDAECAKIEQAFMRGLEQVQLRDDISVNLKLRIRHKTSNRKQQWEAKRVEEGTPHDTKSATEEEACELSARKKCILYHLLFSNHFSKQSKESKWYTRRSRV